MKLTPAELTYVRAQGLCMTEKCDGCGTLLNRGYQVCEKWLKDRRGRTLTYEDLEHYRKVVTALKETLRLMAEIDAASPKWPIP